MSSNLLPTLNSGGKVKDGSTKEDRPYKIFFRDLFLVKENEMAAKETEKFMNRNMKVYQKTTFSSRMKSHSYLSQLAFYPKRSGRSFEKFGPGPAPIPRLIEGSDTKRTVHEFINDQRDRFLLEYALSTKRNTIKKFEKDIAMRERQLKKAEKKLQDDALAFEEFLRENDQRSVDALKMAAQETINKLQMTAELKKASMEVQAVKSEIAKTEFLLREYMKYGFFLLQMSPKHWQIQQALKRAQASKSKANIILPKILAKLSLHSSNKEGILEESGRTAVLSEDASQGRDSQGKPSRSLTRTPEKKKSNLAESFGSEDSLEFLLDDEMDVDLEPALYFKEPEELLQVLRELEEQNLTLFQYSQDVDENLEEVNKREKVIQDKTNSNIEFLLEQEKMLKANCVREEEKAAELQLKSKLFSFGEFNSDAQEILIDSLSKKITQVYKVCIGDAEDDGLNPIQKLVKVESRLVELCDLIESIPKENVEAIERMKQKEWRQKFRDEKMKEKQRHQQERLKAALEKAVAQPKKKLGRRLVFHSKPPSGNKQQLPLVNETKTKSQEEEYFFT
ncbi:coiled-coil domain containing 38 [Homo sapiens]|uniref:Coiled-coil domain-containing protein 38 n=3 Tax=Homo sapiens TaxID=9606 RepID=CCD38_HUMAN|nr:coiled-coil domain-containing protein 38 [Homo sapiens]XP_011536185.1 coiled-coil domain-containing protein 38 isoform X1 [Homo sapiens]Q502W7.1 RecName: Full=Coiled-coil domain-containing protein 38 [Homo sapiens]AAH95479.1 Coiled-coil domain containing 38 [Homo sapiens]EAW97551.1 coiled-coil domain containing 38, isoform CRA_b [Homo sapiens]KAI2567423.1 coiled-coil domain containing 38 [Homo sapiens]KAI4067672.1 coiled-coil domain containing 38 [Homo sapiens]|eukprot:NP_872302.2 coiled-coil domain-containing protein 38 [Homo sapiens]